VDFIRAIFLREVTNGTERSLYFVIIIATCDPHSLVLVWLFWYFSTLFLWGIRVHLISQLSITCIPLFVVDLLMNSESIIAIYNPALTTSFINKWIGLANRIEMNCIIWLRLYFFCLLFVFSFLVLCCSLLSLAANVFRQDFRRTTKSSLFSAEMVERLTQLREMTYAKYELLTAKYEWNDVDNLAPIISVWSWCKLQSAQFDSTGRSWNWFHQSLLYLDDWVNLLFPNLS
jgi:hypothetical protein